MKAHNMRSGQVKATQFYCSMLLASAMDILNDLEQTTLLGCFRTHWIMHFQCIVIICKWIFLCKMIAEVH